MKHLKFYGVRLLVATFLLLSLETISNGCGNEYGYTLNGKRMYTRYFYLPPHMRTFDKHDLNEAVTRVKKELQTTPNDYKLQSNLALYYMKSGSADSALQILEPLAIKYPGEYTILANLGTAYELTGQLDSALKYISKGYEINPKSHQSSEWVHIEILKAKIKRKRQPDYIRKRAILDQDLLEQRIGPSAHRPLHNVNGQVFYQIRTRVPFTPAPNEVITNLLMSMGELNAKKSTIEGALLLYAYALEFNDDPAIKRTIISKIERLNVNKARLRHTEIPHELRRVIKRAQIDPEFLLMGLDKVSYALDSMDQQRFAYEDSLQQIRLKSDSLEILVSQTALERDQLADSLRLVAPALNGTKRRTEWAYLIVWGIGGVFIGIGLMWVALKRRLLS